MTNAEFPMTKEARMTKAESVGGPARVRIWDFVILSSLAIRHSSFKWLVALLFFTLCGLRAAATEYFVSSPADINIVMSFANPGDVLTMSEGIWQDADIVFNGVGTPTSPITLRSEIPGRVLLEGNSRLRIAGSYLVVDGLRFVNGYVLDGDVIAFRESSSSVAENCRVTNCSEAEEFVRKEYRKGWEV